MQFVIQHPWLSVFSGLLLAVIVYHLLWGPRRYSLRSFHEVLEGSELTAAEIKAALEQVLAHPLGDRGNLITAISQVSLLAANAMADSDHDLDEVFLEQCEQDYATAMRAACWEAWKSLPSLPGYGGDVVWYPHYDDKPEAWQLRRLEELSFPDLMMAAIEWVADYEAEQGEAREGGAGRIGPCAIDCA